MTPDWPGDTAPLPHQAREDGVGRRVREMLLAAMRYPECHEEVTRKGELQPCEGIAVAVRSDPNEGGFYPVCSRHTRTPMVRLTDLAATPTEDRP